MIRRLSLDSPFLLSPALLLTVALLLTGCTSAQPVPAPADDPAAASPSPTAQTARWLAAHRDQGPLLRAFLHAMPKGGDLHTHLTGAVYAESYLQWAAEQNLCARFPPGRIVSCSSDAAAPAIPMDSVLASAEQTDRLIDALSIRNLDARPRVTGREQFFATFGRFRAVYADRPARTGDAIAELVRRAAAQNVHHVEIILFDDARTATGRAVDSIAATVAYTDDWALLRDRLLDAGVRDAVARGQSFLDRVTARADSLLGCGDDPRPEACRVTRRYRMHAVRVLPRTAVFARLLYGIERAVDDPRVEAVDMVAPEDHRVALRNYDRHLQMLSFLRRAAGTDADGDSVHVGLHAGELTTGLVPPEHLRDHVWDALTIAGADRVGHAVDVGTERDTRALLRKMSRENIAVEVCLTSNDVILGVDGSEHPLPTFLDAGVPVVLATDDEGVSRIDLTHEYVRAATTYDLDYRTLKRLSRNSLHYAFLDGSSLWRSRSYESYAEPCRDADPAADTVPEACRAFLDDSAKAAAEWRLERAFARFESSYTD